MTGDRCGGVAVESRVSSGSALRAALDSDAAGQRAQAAEPDCRPRDPRRRPRWVLAAGLRDWPRLARGYQSPTTSDSNSPIRMNAAMGEMSMGPSVGITRRSGASSHSESQNAARYHHR